MYKELVCEKLPELAIHLGKILFIIFMVFFIVLLSFYAVLVMLIAVLVEYNNQFSALNYLIIWSCVMELENIR